MTHGKAKNGLVGRWGKLWTRVPANLKKLKSKEIRDVTGVYILYNATMPVYIGRGKVSGQIRAHNRNKRRSPFWEHFSWFEINGKGRDKEIESLFLKVLPHYLRSLNRMGGKFPSARQIEPKTDAPVAILWPKGGPAKKRHRKSRS